MVGGRWVGVIFGARLVCIGAPATRVRLAHESMSICVWVGGWIKDGEVRADICRGPEARFDFVQDVTANKERVRRQSTNHGRAPAGVFLEMASLSPVAE